MARVPWIWEQVEHWTMDDLKETLTLIEEQSEADSFTEAYAEVCGEDIAEANLSYLVHLIALKDAAEGERLQELFGVEPQSSKLYHTFGFSSLGIGDGHPAHPEHGKKKAKVFENV